MSKKENNFLKYQTTYGEPQKQMGNRIMNFIKNGGLYGYILNRNNNHNVNVEPVSTMAYNPQNMRTLPEIYTSLHPEKTNTQMVYNPNNMRTLEEIYRDYNPTNTVSDNDPLYASKTATSRLSPAAKIAKTSVLKPQTQHRGETVAAMWTRLTGTPWKTAKELGLTDGSYESNIKVLKDLKAGQYTKDYVSGLINYKNNPSGEPLTIQGAYGPQGLTPQEQIGIPVDTSNWGERVTTTPQRYSVDLPDYGFVAESPFVTAESRMDADAQSTYDEAMSRIGGYYR